MNMNSATGCTRNLLQ